MGLQDFGVGGRAGAAELGGISGAAADGSDFGFPLRDALEPAGQSLEGRAVYGSDEAGEAETRRCVCAGAGGGRLHGECAAGGFDAAGCAAYVRARRRAIGGGTRRAAAADRATPVRVEEREVGSRVYATGSRPAGILGAQWLSRVRRPMEGAKIFGKVEVDCWGPIEELIRLLLTR